MAEFAVVVAAAAAAAGVMTGMGADAGNTASHSASCRNAVVAGAAGGGGVGEAGRNGSVVVMPDEGLPVRTAAGDAVVV